MTLSVTFLLLPPIQHGYALFTSIMWRAAHIRRNVFNIPYRDNSSRGRPKYHTRLFPPPIQCSTTSFVTNKNVPWICQGNVLRLRGEENALFIVAFCKLNASSWLSAWIDNYLQQFISTVLHQLRCQYLGSNPWFFRIAQPSTTSNRTNLPSRAAPTSPILCRDCVRLMICVVWLE